MKAMITRKIGMGSIITENGEMVAVTLLSATPNVVTQIKTVENEGYNAIAAGFENGKNISKPQLNHFKKSNSSPKVVKELRGDINPDIKIGDEIKVDQFTVGDIIDVTGTSKGKGFAGGIKRWNFHRGRKTHGGRSYRRPGSIGSMYPQKIFKGKKMAGQLGHETVTTKNLKVALVDTDNNILGVVGAVPGPNKSIVMIKGAK